MSHKIKPRSRIDQSRVWVYFKQSDGDPDKARCNLCSTEISHRGTTNVLWNHVKIKHSIDRSTLSQDNLAQVSFKNANNNKSATRTRNSNNGYQFSHHQTNRSDQIILDYNDLSITSMKPLPSTSLSKNLISRLNQLSSPVTRKLKFWNKKSFQVNQYDPSFKVIYLGNLGVQLWSKDESCLDKPLSTLWNNYLVNMKTEIVMRLTICNSGLKAITRQHGLTQYWSNRLVYCCSHKNYPRIFSWVYRHEGKKMRQELRCHAVFCPTPEKASKMVTLLNERIACALQEFRREKKSRSSSTITATQNESPFCQNLQRTVPLRRQILAKGSANFRPPLERSKSAPKLTSIMEEEDYESSLSDTEEVAEQLHDVFEYEESFEDKEDDDDGEDDGDDNDDNSDISAKHDEDSANKIESNSLTNTTVNEESSNSSSAYATGDRSYEKRKAPNDGQESSVYPASTTDNIINISASINSRSNQTTDRQRDSNSVHTKESHQNTTIRLMNDNDHDHHYHNNHHDNGQRESNPSKNYITNHNFSHKTNQNTSANTNISSSSIVDKRQTHDDKLLLVNQQAKKKPTTGMDLPDDDDVATGEIVLSWSNLVIK